MSVPLLCDEDYRNCGAPEYGERIADLERQLAEAKGLAANLAQRLQEAKDRKVLLNGMTQEQKAAIFDIKAIVSDGVRHYDAAILSTGGKGD